MSALAETAADYRELLSRTETLVDDHSSTAIWRRARRAASVDASRSRRWKARAIGLNPDPLTNGIALSGMIPLQVDEAWMLAVALPQPNPCGGWMDEVDDLLIIDPSSGAAHVMGDIARTHVSPRYQTDRVVVAIDAKAWARHIATDRLEWWMLRRERQRAMRAEPTWTGEPSAALLLAKPAKVRWSDFDAKVLDVPADLRRDVQRAVMAQARIPRIEGRA